MVQCQLVTCQHVHFVSLSDRARAGSTQHKLVSLKNKYQPTGDCSNSKPPYASFSAAGGSDDAFHGRLPPGLRSGRASAADRRRLLAISQRRERHATLGGPPLLGGPSLRAGDSPKCRQRSRQGHDSRGTVHGSLVVAEELRTRTRWSSQHFVPGEGLWANKSSVRRGLTRTDWLIKKHVNAQLILGIRNIEALLTPSCILSDGHKMGSPIDQCRCVFWHLIIDVPGSMKQ